MTAQPNDKRPIEARIFDSLVNDAYDAIIAYFGRRDADELIEAPAEVLDRMGTFRPGGEASKILGRAEPVIANGLAGDLENEVKHGAA